MVAPGVRERAEAREGSVRARGVLPAEGLWLGPTLPQGLGTRDPVPGQAKRLSAVRTRRAGPEEPSPVVQHVVDQVDEVQPKLEVCAVRGDAVPEVAGHQLAVWRRLGVAEHPVLPGL